MQNKLTRDIVKHDKKLREKIEFLELEKSHLDDTIFREKELITEAFQSSLEKLLKKTKKENEQLFKEKETTEKKAFEERLTHIKKTYDDNKDAWIESIFSACIDESGDFS